MKALPHRELGKDNYSPSLLSPRTPSLWRSVALFSRLLKTLSVKVSKKNVPQSTYAKGPTNVKYLTPRRSVLGKNS